MFTATNIYSKFIARTVSRGLDGVIMRKLETNVMLALFLIFIGAVGRIALSSYPNIETIMVVTFIAAVYIRSWYALLVPLTALFISDLFMGNLTMTSSFSQILIFTYTGFLFVALISRHYRQYFRQNSASLDRVSIANTSMFGILFVLVFDVWTNIGAYLLMYPHTLDGLFLCYTMAIPFMLNHIVSGAVTFAVIVAPVINILGSRDPVEDPSSLPAPEH